MFFLTFLLFLTFSEGKMTVGDAVSRDVAGPAGLVDEEEAEEAATPLEDSSMDRDAMAPGAGVSDDGMLLGGCCFFLIMSL